MDEGQQLAIKNRQPATNTIVESSSSNHPPLLGRPSYDLANELTRLIAAFTFNIDESADIKIQLPWNFGPFLSDIPCRLGTNEALDAAAQALVTSYTHFIAGDAMASADILIDHSNALSALRQCLDDPVKAYSSETLCSTMILLIVQVCGQPHHTQRLFDPVLDLAGHQWPRCSEPFHWCSTSTQRSRIYWPQGRLRE